MTTKKPIPSDTELPTSAEHLQATLCERATSHGHFDERFSFDSSMSDAEIRTKFDTMLALARKSRISKENANELP